MVSSVCISLTEKDVLKEEPISLCSSVNPSPLETIFLSNIDQTVTFPVETVFFFEIPSNQSSATVNVAEIVKEAVKELLGPYYFLAGRLNFNQETKRLELLCNNAGVLFVTATSGLSQKELGNLSQPNPTFHHFVQRPGLFRSLAETALFTIQVTRFSCGGFSIGFTTNHAILDGKSASEMFENLASICRGEGLKVKVINNNRTCMKARILPQISYPHNEYVKLAKTSSLASSFTSQNRISPSPLVFSNKYVHELFSFTPEMLKTLKEKAITKCSTFEVIVAHLWRARTKAVFKNHQDNNHELSTVLFAVDVRSRISPPLPKGFVGNAVVTAFATAEVKDLVDKPFSFIVGKMKEARERVTNDYIRSVIDWLEVYKGIPATGYGTFYVSAWWKLPFTELDFGFGKPRHGGPVASGNDEFVLLLAGENSGEKWEGINVLIGLEKENMERLMPCIFEI